MAPQPRRQLELTDNKIIIDGTLEDWGTKKFPYSFGSSGADGHVEWDARLGAEHLYLAARVTDDAVVVRPEETAWQQDYVSFVINAAPLAASVMNTGSGWYSDSYLLLASPSTQTVRGTDFYQERYTDYPAEYVCRTVPGGYVLEAAIPLTYVKEQQGDAWRSLRINVSIQDEDPGQKEKPRTSWQPEWRGEKNVLGSGLFFRR